MNLFIEKAYRPQNADEYTYLSRRYGEQCVVLSDEEWVICTTIRTSFEEGDVSTREDVKIKRVTGRGWSKVMEEHFVDN